MLEIILPVNSESIIYCVFIVIISNLPGPSPHIILIINGHGLLSGTKLQQPDLVDVESTN